LRLSSDDDSQFASFFLGHHNELFLIFISEGFYILSEFIFEIFYEFCFEDFFFRLNLSFDDFRE